MNPKFEELRKNWMDFEEFKEKFQKVTVEEYPNNVLQAVPKPEITVKITTYQHAPYIREAIDSVLMQKVDVPWEIIIGDDESTDGTREICIEYAKKYPDLIRLFLHKRENNIKLFDSPTHLFQYYYNSFNCRGKYITGCSGDDFWTDEKKIQKQHDMFGKNKNTSMVYHKWKYKTETTRKNNTIKKTENIVQNRPVTQTWMIINIFDKIPYEMTKVLQEDTFTKMMLSIFYGKFLFVSNIAPSIYRIKDNSIFSTIANIDVEKHRVNRDLNMHKVLVNYNNISKHKMQNRLAGSLSEYLIHHGNRLSLDDYKSIYGIAYDNNVVIHLIKKILYKKLNIIK